MKNEEYVSLIHAGEYPENIVVPIDPSFIDSRGTISNIWLGNSGSVTYIESFAGAIRANHKHSLDHHSCFIISGKVKYTEFSDEGKTVSKEYIFSDKDMFFTKPGIFHRMEFLEDTKMITCNNQIKNHYNYEQDIKRF